ncbi:MAG: MotA/TolQ/ExbB proton channel family protein [Myxococcota bacterium]
MLELIFDASPVVTVVLIALALTSIASWAVILLKYRELVRAEGDTQEFLQAYLAGPLEAAYEVARERRASPLAGLFVAGFEELARRDERSPGDRVEGVVRRLSWLQTEEVHRLERGLPFLATTGSSAPFVGLFGTVVGIMNSFADIGTSGSASLVVVAPGIAEALVATAVGLFVAIPAVIAYNYADARLAHLRDRLEAFRSEFGDVLRERAARAA